MKIEFYPAPQAVDIRKFADEHNLIMEVHERENPRFPNEKYYAHFKECGVRNSNVLFSYFANGSTKDDAISEYARGISNCVIVINPSGVNEKKIKTPSLFF